MRFKIALLVPIAVALLIAPPAPAAGLDSEVNSVQADLAAAAGRDFVLYHNDIFPGMLLRTRSRTLYLFRELGRVGLSAPTHMAWSERGSVRVAAAPAQSGVRLDKPWIIVWFSGGQGWQETRFIRHSFNRSPSFKPQVSPIDVPWMIVLQRPAVARLDAEGLAIEAQEPLGDVVVMPLFASQKLSPRVTARWAAGLPRDVVQRADRWTAISRRFPVYVKEDYQVDEAADEVRIRNTFDYITIRDAWNTEPRTIAPVAPVIALAYAGNWRVNFDRRPTDLQTVTHWGPYYAVEGAQGHVCTIRGILKYIDEVETIGQLNTAVPGFEEARDLLLRRMSTAAGGGADPRGAYSIDWGMGMLGAWMRAMKLLPDDLKKRLSDYIQREDLLNGYFLNPDIYVEEQVPIGEKATIPVLVVKPRKGLQTYSDDLVKQTSRMPYVVWQYGYYSGDWDTVRAKYDMVKKMYGFNLLLGWSNVGPEYTAEHAKISAKQGPIGLGRLAKQFGDQATYDYAAYLLAKALINEWVWDMAAVPYITRNAPWFHNTEGDWIMHQNHGYAGLQGLPLDQVRTYGEIPLVLDRFNREELWEYNDYYVRMRHKYIPTTRIDNVYVTDFGDAPDLKSLLAKPLTELVKPEALKGQSHVTPGFYNYPIDLMELGSEMSYQRLYEKGTQEPQWRRGLDALSRGQSWRQMAIAVRKDWTVRTSAGTPWPYPAWYLMNPPRTHRMFVNDALPFGLIQPDLRRQPAEGRIDIRPNWNSYLSATDLR